MLNRLGNQQGGEERAISFQSIWGAGDSLAWANQAGTNITADSSLKIGAVWAAVKLISDSISTLPVDCYYRFNGERVPLRPKPIWVDKPDIDNTRETHYGQVIVSLMLWGNAYVRIFRDPNDVSQIVHLVPLDPTTVQVKRDHITGRKVFTYLGEDRTLTTDDVLHIVDLPMPGKLEGVSRVDKLGDMLGVADALQSFAARYFGQGSTMAGVIEYPGALTREQAKALAEGFDSRHRGFRNSGKTGILSGGAKFVPTSANNDQSQFIASRQFAVEEVARAFQIPPHMLGVPNTTSYASVEAQMINFVTNTLRPVIEKIEGAYSSLLANKSYLKFNVEGLLRGDVQSRFSAYSIARQGGWMSINDVLKLEDQPKVEGGDTYSVPLANVDVKAANLAETNERVSMADKLIQIGFAPEDVLKALGLPAIKHTGVPSTKLQQVQNIDPVDPGAVY